MAWPSSDGPRFRDHERTPMLAYSTNSVKRAHFCWHAHSWARLAGYVADMETLALNGVEFLTWWLIEQSAEDKEQYGELCRCPIDHVDDTVVGLHTTLC